MSDNGLSRRGVLRRGAATASAATLASLAGCSSVPFLGGGGGNYQFMFEPGAAGDRDHYFFSRLDINTIRNNEDAFEEETFDALEEQQENAFEIPDIDLDEMNSVLQFGGFQGGVRLLNGSYNNSDVTEELEDAEGDFDDSDYEGYTIYYSEDRGVAFAVGNFLIRTAPIGDEDAEEVAELVIDTGNGNEDRYQAESDALNDLLGAFGSPTRSFGVTSEPTEEDAPEQGSFENAVAAGQTDTVNGETTIRRWFRVFEEQDDVDTGDFEDWTDEQEDETFDDVDDIKINQNGRTVVVKGQIDTDEL